MSHLHWEPPTVNPAVIFITVYVERLLGVIQQVIKDLSPFIIGQKSQPFTLYAH